jgi:hypothetical protein
VQGGRELGDGILRAHDLAEDGTIALPERDGNPVPVRVLLLVEHDVGEKDSHLPSINLVDQGIVGEVDRLHGIDRIREHRLPIRREADGSVRNGRADNPERRPHAPGAHLVRHPRHGDDPPVLGEADGSYPISPIIAYKMHLQLVNNPTF